MPTYKDPIKNSIYDPESFLEGIEESCSAEITEYMNQRTEEWKARGKNKAIRSSSLGTCIRQSYYGYYSKRESIPITDEVARRRMYMGFVNEETQAKILGRMPGHLHGVESIEQNQFPVHLNITENVTYTATTDFVHEYEYKDQQYYIPMELKSTELWKWKEFKYHPYHLKQILLWMYYAKEKLHLNVPYGVLMYTKRSSMENKYVVISCDTRFEKMSREVQKYDYWKPWLDNHVNTITSSILQETVPPRPTDVPQYICSGCTYLDLCNRNANHNE